MSLYSSLRQVLAPYAAKLNGLLTGYDGTEYNSPGEAVRSQISALHVLIGDEPGTAINASAIGYDDGNVEDALDGLNERLDGIDAQLNDVIELVYDTDIEPQLEEVGSQIYKNATTGQYVKASTSGVAYWKLTTFDAEPLTNYKAFGAYAKDAPVAVFVDADGNYIGSTDSHPDAGYAGTREYVEFTTPAGTSKIVTNIFSYSYTSTLVRGTYKNALSDDIDEIKTVLGDVDLTDTSPGYFNEDGTVHDATDTAEVYMNQYLPVIPGETLTVNIVLSTGKAQWARWCFYDSEKNVVGSGTQNQTWTASLSIQITIPDYVTYIRVSYRTHDILSSFSISKNDALTVGLIDYSNAILKKIIKHNPNCVFTAHQGYDPESVGTNTGHNKLEGYYKAAEHGFDVGETDVRFTLDDVPVCCHDGSFVDATTGDTVVIASTNYEDLITHDYYGGVIASFEDVLKACKNTGMGLVIDQLSITASDKWDIVFNIVKKYGMGRKVYWTLFATHTAFYNAVHSAFPKTGYEFLQTSGVTVAEMITYANSIANLHDDIIVGVNYGTVSASDVAAYAATCVDGVRMGVWTIPAHIPTCLNYLPYVGMITTNRTCYNDVWNYGVRA